MVFGEFGTNLSFNILIKQYRKRNNLLWLQCFQFHHMRLIKFQKNMKASFQKEK